MASAIGVAFSLASPFLNWSPVLSWLPAPDITFPFVIASVLAAIAFGINKRPEVLPHSTYRLARFRCALQAVPVVFSVVAVAEPIIDHFGSSVPSVAASDPLRALPSGSR
jgi:hypothetical protein